MSKRIERIVQETLGNHAFVDKVDDGLENNTYFVTVNGVWYSAHREELERNGFRIGFIRAENTNKFRIQIQEVDDHVQTSSKNNVDHITSDLRTISGSN